MARWFPLAALLAITAVAAAGLIAAPFSALRTPTVAVTEAETEVEAGVIDTSPSFTIGPRDGTGGRGS